VGLLHENKRLRDAQKVLETGSSCVCIYQRVSFLNPRT